MKCFMSILLVLMLVMCCAVSYGNGSWRPKEERQQEVEEMSKEFQWWPTDAKPGPVKDEERSGMWWWPDVPGKMRPWGNRGYCYVYKIIFDYKEEELPEAKPEELRPSLLIKKVIKNVKIYYDFDKANLREDAVAILKDAIRVLNKKEEADILITGNADMRGSEKYNMKLGRKRALAVKRYLVDNGIPEERIRIVSRGKMDAIAPLRDLVGMQKDRNAHFMIAEVEEIMIPYPSKEKATGLKEVEEGKFVEERKLKIESKVMVSTREYVVKRGDTLWSIAKKEYGGSHRWKYLYEINKDRIKDPKKLKAGMKIMIPVE